MSDLRRPHETPSPVWSPLLLAPAGPGARSQSENLCWWGPPFWGPVLVLGLHGPVHGNSLTSSLRAKEPTRKRPVITHKITPLRDLPPGFGLLPLDPVSLPLLPRHAGPRAVGGPREEGRADGLCHFRSRHKNPTKSSHFPPSHPQGHKPGPWTGWGHTLEGTCSPRPGRQPGAPACTLRGQNGARALLRVGWNRVPTKDAEAPALRTWEGGLIWKWGLCRASQVRLRPWMGPDLM